MRAVNKESVTEDLAHLTVPFQIELNAEILNTIVENVFNIWYRIAVYRYRKGDGGRLFFPFSDIVRQSGKHWKCQGA